jgi:hypothetical protein
MEKSVRKYLSEIGSKGGKKSRRILTSEQARAMRAIRTQKRELENELQISTTKSD